VLEVLRAFFVELCSR